MITGNEPALPPDSDLTGDEPMLSGAKVVVWHKCIVCWDVFDSDTGHLAYIFPTKPYPTDFCHECYSRFRNYPMPPDRTEWSILVSELRKGKSPGLSIEDIWDGEFPPPFSV